MAFVVDTSGERVEVRLTGWDRAMNWRGSIVFDLSAVTRAAVEDRASLEALIDHRSMGCGTHNGAKRPNQRRIGTMLGRGVTGNQFWAVPAGGGTDPLLVLELHDHEFVRAVLAANDPQTVAADIERALGQAPPTN